MVQNLPGSPPEGDPSHTPGWVGGYTLHHQIGQGGTGTVWEAEDEGGHRVALKLLHPSLAATEEARLRLLREARLVNQVRSPGIVRVLDVEADAYSPFVVTELVEGPTLEQEITRLRYRGDDAAQLGTEIAGTLEAVHAVGIAHRDLKPSNIILSATGPTLIDFGIAHGEGDHHLTQTGGMTGTPGYVAPELLSATERPSMDQLQQGDWFALSASLLKAMTGSPPFGRGRTDAILMRVLSGEPDTSGLDDAIALAFWWALRPDPDERLTPYDLIACLGGAQLVLPDADELDEDEAAAETTMLVDLPGPRAPLPVEPVSPWQAVPTTEVFGTPSQAPSYPVEAFRQWVPQPVLPPPPGAPLGVVGTLASLGLIGSLAWLPAFWGVAGVGALLAVLCFFQVLGAAATKRWQLLVERSQGLTRGGFSRLIATFRSGMGGLLKLVPGVVLGTFTYYIVALVIQGVLGGAPDPDSPLEWLDLNPTGEGRVTLAVWIAITVGLVSCWMITTSRPLRTGVAVALDAAGPKVGGRWVVAVVLLIPALLCLGVMAVI
ncbi:serine/threonine-protein kinase [Actinomyces minihominis]|uniref:serine/threonine-protein kinase n=1 Tax=Actinomyces minihominis TaxID=2002838 RepID=UPI000C072E34|nr:serine/threonine-protein kinase [Actinomyces minihominis]